MRISKPPPPGFLKVSLYLFNTGQSHSDLFHSSRTLNEMDWVFADNLVGRGGGSEVFRGNLQDGKVVAVKRLNHGPQSEVEFLIDIEMNTALTHPNIISLIGYCVESSHMLLVYEYLPEGNLEDQLYRKSSQAFGKCVELRVFITQQMTAHAVWLFSSCLFDVEL